MTTPRGISFPPRFGPLGHLERSDGSQKIHEAVRAIAITALGERFGRRSFGVLRVGHFRAFDEFTCRLLEDSLAEGLTSSDARIVVRSVTCYADTDRGQVFAHVAYVNLAAGRDEEIEFPVGDLA